MTNKSQIPIKQILNIFESLKIWFWILFVICELVFVIFSLKEVVYTQIYHTTFVTLLWDMTLEAISKMRSRFFGWARCPLARFTRIFDRLNRQTANRLNLQVRRVRSDGTTMNCTGRWPLPGRLRGSNNSGYICRHQCMPFPLPNWPPPPDSPRCRYHRQYIDAR